MQKIVVAITGASGSIYAKLLLTKLQELRDQIESLAVVMTTNAKEVWKQELGNDDWKNLQGTFYEKTDFTAPFASGSAKYNTMIIVPCSMGTLGRIATGISNDLITRSADVVLKEKRKLICVAREAPYNIIHLKNMETITLAGGIICPATPSFYHNPKTVEEVAMTVVERIIDLAGLEQDARRWNE